MLNIHKIIEIVNGKTNFCINYSENLLINNINIDSRISQKNELFIAIEGENFDGHNYVIAAEKAGAIACIVNRFLPNIKILQIKVCDTKISLRQIASHICNNYFLPKIAITGSCGKTTTKKLTESILSTKFTTLASAKSFNNDIGVPLTAFNLLNTAYETVVFEIGTNKPGEIDSLTKIVQPNIAVITNIGESHLAGFNNNIDNIFAEKSDIFNYLQANEKFSAIINYDDKYYKYWQQRLQQKNLSYLSFGLNSQADIYASNINFNANEYYIDFNLHYKKQQIAIKLPLLGKHNIYNALAAACVGIKLNINLSAIKNGLEQCSAAQHRMLLQQGINNCIIIDDSYNANPTSTQAAINFLSALPGQKIFVFGDMEELGINTIQLHEKIGLQARELGIDSLLTIGKLAVHSANKFGKNAVSFQNKNELSAHMQKLANNNVTFLLKASNKMQLWKISNQLLAGSTN